MYVQTFLKNLQAHRSKSIFFYAAYQGQEVRSSYETYEANRLENHVSYLLCPGKEAMRIETSYPVSNIRVFYKKLRKRTAKRNAQPKHFIDVYHWLM